MSEQRIVMDEPAQVPGSHRFYEGEDAKKEAFQRQAAGESSSETRTSSVKSKDKNREIGQTYAYSNGIAGGSVATHAS